ncbi:fructokinase [Thiohalospira halophila DSM 15071]|uniref:Fructokinase n=1 Tax=Thiohalospira halophila DSM 15071 TaxID=1123397 RepID=A0A1I1NRV3_9GAMM|nr:PfkB family carbohydrate kinase [Thiohalospira halophila]SFD00156.1 fructokinase [Thiohalospira halophila DSM 15071]
MEDVRTAPTIFGEVLFDEFGDHAVLGGAPFNVAWHLRGLGQPARLVSRMGEDDYGRRIREAMARWDLDDAGLQRDTEHPTGRVRVELAAGEPTYEIVTGVAWDAINAEAAVAAVGHPGLLYHGTLAAREGRSRAALEALRARADGIFVDVNLRPPWWERHRMAALLDGARWIKLNGDELAELTGADDAAAAETLRQRHGATGVLVTRGGEGAELFTESGVERAVAAPVAHFEDAVGAGDALAAVFLLGELAGWEAGMRLRRGVELASAVCGLRGAVSDDPDFYEPFRKQWLP